jgi:hypothetical protein
MHVKHGLAVLIRKQSPGARDLVNVVEDMHHGVDRTGVLVPRSDDEFTAVGGTAEDDHGGGGYRLFNRKLLNFLMDGFTIFQADNENSTLPCFSKFHADLLPASWNE